MQLSATHMTAEYFLSPETVQILHDERVRIAWKAMRLIQKHFMRAEEENATPEARANVAEAISVYSKNIELVFGVRACTYNLHMLDCR